MKPVLWTLLTLFSTPSVFAQDRAEELKQIETIEAANCVLNKFDVHASLISIRNPKTNVSYLPGNATQVLIADQRIKNTVTLISNVQSPLEYTTALGSKLELQVGESAIVDNLPLDEASHVEYRTVYNNKCEIDRFSLQEKTRGAQDRYTVFAVSSESCANHKKLNPEQKDSLPPLWKALVKESCAQFESES